MEHVWRDSSEAVFYIVVVGVVKSLFLLAGQTSFWCRYGYCFT